MSSSVFEATLAFERRRSVALSAAVVLAWSAAAGGVLLSIDGLFPVALVPLACAGCWFGLRRLGPGWRLWWRGAGDWRLDDPDGSAWTLGGSTWSAPWLILLVLHGPSGTVRIPLARDAVDAVAWRRLRARLRIAGPEVGSAGSER